MKAACAATHFLLAAHQGSVMRMTLSPQTEIPFKHFLIRNSVSYAFAEF